MGMFDYVTMPLQHCSLCSAPLNGWQSKDGDCTLSEIPYWRCINFYTSCDKCGAWHEYGLLHSAARPLSDYHLTVEPRQGSPATTHGANNEN